MVIDLPLFQQAPVNDTPLTTQAARVLVVDDEPVLLRIAARILRKQGYEVETAQNGMEALARYQAPSDYDLVLLDSTMPAMSGREVLEEILRRDPAARILVMSGYSVDCGPAELLARGAREFLPKPFTPQELLDALRRVLSGGSASDR